jgi:hypothetical protein
VSHVIWTPGAAGPLDELVSRLMRMVQEFSREHGIEQAEVRIELADGSRHVLASASAEPGYGFLSFVPHSEADDEPRRVIVPIGAVKLVEISPPDPTRHFGFTSSAGTG